MLKIISFGLSIKIQDNRKIVLVNIKYANFR